MSAKIHYNLSQDEEIAFKELKRRFYNQSEIDAENEFRLYRFLKARKFIVNDAENMIRNNLRFRQKMKLDTILDDFQLEEPMESYFATSVLGLDKQSSIVILVDVGNGDYIGLTKSIRKDDFIKSFVLWLERTQKYIFKENQKTGKITGCTVILDYTNFSFATATNRAVLDYFLEFGRIFEPNYPELLRIGYIINVPSYYSYIFNLVKIFAATETIQKINVYGKEGWQSELLNLMDLEVLPAYLGGRKTDPDGNPNCIQCLQRGKPVPKHFYLMNAESHFSSQADVKKYYIRAMSKISIAHEVDTPESLIEWQFESKAHNIGFGLRFKSKKDENPIDLIPVERVNAHLQCETGAFACMKPGIYLLVLDNSFSWFRGKYIFMKSSVQKPQEETKAN